MTENPNLPLPMRQENQFLRDYPGLLDSLKNVENIEKAVPIVAAYAKQHGFPVVVLGVFVHFLCRKSGIFFAFCA